MHDAHPDFSDLPILRELGESLRHAFERSERHATAIASASPRRRRPRLLLALGGLLVACVVAVAVALTSGIDAGHVTPTPATAADALRQAAGVADHSAAPFPRDDQFYFVRSRTTDLVTSASADQADAIPSALVTKERSIWTSTERSGRLEERVVATKFATDADEQKWEALGKPSLAATPASGGQPIPIEPIRQYRLGGIPLTREQMLDFPTDPQAIYERLRAEVGSRGSSPDGEVFTELGDALRESPAPAALRGALYRTLALVPGIQLVGTVTDSIGRTGTAVSFTEVGVRKELIFDPATSELLAEREILVDPRAAELNLPAGTVIGDSTYLQRAVTDQPTTP